MYPRKRFFELTRQSTAACLGVVCALLMISGCTSNKTIPLLPDSSKGANTKYTINVRWTDSDECLYEILEYANQDTFIVKPLSRVKFNAVNTDIDVQVQTHQAKPSDPKFGQRGMKPRDNAFRVRSNRFRQAMVRDSLRMSENDNTLHKVWLFCIDDEGNGIPARAIGDDPFSQLFGTESDAGPNAYTEDISTTSVSMVDPGRSGNSDVAIKKRRAPGGPDMEVDDP